MMVTGVSGVIGRHVPCPVDTELKREQGTATTWEQTRVEDYVSVAGVRQRLVFKIVKVRKDEYPLTVCNLFLFLFFLPFNKQS